MCRLRMTPLLMAGALLLLFVACFMAVGTEAQQQVKDPYKVLSAVPVIAAYLHSTRCSSSV